MFVVIELQATETNVASITNTFNTRPEAESHWHYILSAAAVSDVKKHSALLMDDGGNMIASACYEHPTLTNN